MSCQHDVKHLLPKFNWTNSKAALTAATTSHLQDANDENDEEEEATTVPNQTSNFGISIVKPRDTGAKTLMTSSSRDTKSFVTFPVIIDDETDYESESVPLSNLESVLTSSATILTSSATESSIRLSHETSDYEEYFEVEDAEVVKPVKQSTMHQVQDISTRDITTNGSSTRKFALPSGEVYQNYDFAVLNSGSMESHSEDGKLQA